MVLRPRPGARRAVSARLFRGRVTDQIQLVSDVDELTSLDLLVARLDPALECGAIERSAFDLRVARERGPDGLHDVV